MSDTTHSMVVPMPMSFTSITDAELLAYLDEMLPTDRAASIEKELRDSAALRQHATLLARRRDQGGHTVGEIWRRERLSCLTRSQLGSYLLDALDDAFRSYVDFHLHTIGCRICAANLDDLISTQQRADGTARQRRRKIFESSAGMLQTR